ncbi:right-handed parallel beta-helix repeat-containing protein [Streptomyces sp. B1866]|uniref:right-handed parallel beta-helix repeat-containing protein n=1 Tax=Streptomyces sp. B1866 TaxID=3075431 RepID=UPI0028921E9C|nr:right-handed parallel beta-helix repeat-containing protein [Streptomyces sp. B1866]MDT3395955.1 right-handed parallel beta-helix repeat-containing protein [Streptomyces sp. B1866]
MRPVAGDRARRAARRPLARSLALPLALLAAWPVTGVPAAAGTPAPGRAAPEELYVAPGGRDTWPGTADRPFATLERAQRAVRARTPSMRADLVVNVRGGTYRLPAPLRLSAARGDSGAHGHRVVYQAYGYGTPHAEQVTLSGGRPVTGWRPAADLPGASGVWRADVRALETRQLYVDGRRAHRASLGAGLPGEVVLTRTGYVTDSAAPLAWHRPQDVEFVYNGAWGAVPYSESRCGVASVAREGGGTRITMDQPCFQRLKDVYRTEPEEPADPVDPTNVENSASFLARRPGGWYLDRSRPGHHVLYYLPRPGEDPRRVPVVAPVLEGLVDGAGTAGEPLHDIAFRGLEFGYATWLAPSGPAGFPHIIGGTYSTGGDSGATVPGAVSLRATRRVTVEGSRFRHLGGQALELSDGGADDVVRDNLVEDVSGGGIRVGGTGVNQGARVADNRVRRVGVEYRGGIGITLDGTREATVEHNEIADVPYSGIWGESSTGLRILANDIRGAVYAVPDGGGVYLPFDQGPSYEGGAVVRGNVIEGTGIPYSPDEDPASSAVYADVDADHVTVEGNVLYRNAHALGGVAPKGVRATGNYWDDDVPRWLPDTRPPGVTVTGNAALPRTDPRAACQAVRACAAILAAAGPR